MVPDGLSADGRRTLRRDLLRRYVYLQKELIDADTSSSSYQAIVHAYRQMGQTLISSGFEEDLDRLLRIRVLDGGRALPLPKTKRTVPDELYLIEAVSFRPS